MIGSSWIRSKLPSSASGSVVPRQGWQPCHLGLWRGEQLIAAAPLYLKGHSYGEFVFDQSFAQLAAGNARLSTEQTAISEKTVGGRGCQVRTR